MKKLLLVLIICLGFGTTCFAELRAWDYGTDEWIVFDTNDTDLQVGKWYEAFDYRFGGYHRRFQVMGKEYKNGKQYVKLWDNGWDTWRYVVIE
ncbi:MAG: hypothetical protein KBS60_03910 [Phascolarctobacterium sp.]|nr:hypothetical protein [Candidatus Phascolarctobacterium caballi]